VRAALGFRPHTGWATAVVLGAPPARSPAILERRRVDLSDPVIPREVFHAARELGPQEAEELVRQAREAAREAATRAVGDLVAELAASGHQVVAAGIPGIARLPSALSKILASHPYVHTAEGRLFREALAEAAERCGLVVSRTVADQAGEILDHDEEALRRTLADLGRPRGPPWRQDEKDAALAARLALAIRR
jgi:hypothetical protein